MADKWTTWGDRAVFAASLIGLMLIATGVIS